MQLNLRIMTFPSPSPLKPKLESKMTQACECGLLTSPQVHWMGAESVPFFYKCTRFTCTLSIRLIFGLLSLKSKHIKV